jgi:hypothetical protein
MRQSLCERAAEEIAGGGLEDAALTKRTTTDALLKLKANNGQLGAVYLHNKAPH